MLDILAQALGRLQGDVFADCLMGNHYHVVLRTRQPNLSRIMRHVNGQYARTFNKRHNVAGHLFQGRFHAIVVDRDDYLMEVCRYVEIEPATRRSGRFTGQMAVVSYRANVGSDVTEWLAKDELRSHLLGRQSPG